MKRLIPKDGDVRIRRKFLFLPRTINRIKIWWEVATWTEILQVSPLGRGNWRAYAWGDKREAATLYYQRRTTNPRRRMPPNPPPPPQARK